MTVSPSGVFDARTPEGLDFGLLLRTTDHRPQTTDLRPRTTDRRPQTAVGGPPSAVVGPPHDRPIPDAGHGSDPARHQTPVAA